MVAVSEILREDFEVQSGGILSTGGQALGYNVIDTRYEPSDPRHIVRTFDNAQAAQNYNNQINARLRANPNFDPRAPVAPAPLRADPNDRPDLNTNRTQPAAAPDNVVRRPPIADWDDNDSRMLTRDNLDRNQRNTLRRTGQVAIGGFNYTNADFDAIEARARQRASILMRENDNVRQVATTNKEVLQTPRGTRMIRALIPNYLGASLGLIPSLRNALIDIQAEAIAGDITWEQYNAKVDVALGMWFTATVLPYVFRVAAGTAGGAANTLLMGKLEGFLPGLGRNRGGWRQWLTRALAKNVASYVLVRTAFESETGSRAIAELFKSEYIDDQTDIMYQVFGRSASAARALNVTINREFPDAVRAAYNAVRNATGDVRPEVPGTVNDAEQNQQQGDGTPLSTDDVTNRF